MYPLNRSLNIPKVLIIRKMLFLILIVKINRRLPMIKCGNHIKPSILQPP